MNSRRIVALLAACTLGLGALVATGAPQAAEQSLPRDVLIVVDNTGVSAADWALQKRAYLAMLESRTDFPLDGSVALSFVQYAESKKGGPASRVTVPVTVLDGERALGKVTASILQADLLAPEVAGEDGISAAVADWRKNGRPSAAPSVCATANAPWTSAAVASASATAKGAGIARLGMLTVANQSLNAALAAERFGNVIIGDGRITTVVDFPQFSTVVRDSCLLPALRLEAIEVNQSIQDWENSMPLVEYKDTLVRVFLETVTGRSTTTSGLLYGYRDGAPLSNSPLSPVNSGGAVVIDGDIDNASDRAGASTSLNFRLPTSWLSGDVSLEFVSSASMTCGAAPRATQDCEVDVSFNEAAEPSINYVSVPWTSSGVLKEPTDAELVEQMYRTQDTLPLRYVDFDFDWLPWTVDDTKPSLEGVNAYLYLYAMYEGCMPGMCDEYFYGVIDGYGGGLANDAPGSIASGYLDDAGAPGDYAYARNRGPHEIAHMLGIEHVVNEARNGTTTKDGYEGPAGWCTEIASTSAPDFPYWTTLSGREYPTLGPMGDPDEEIWGLSTRAFDGGLSGLVAVSPYTVFPLMSYCGALDTSSQYRWTAAPDHLALAETLFDPGFGRSAPRPRDAARDVVIIRGQIDAQDSDAASFLPAAFIPSVALRAIDPGDWSVRLVDARGRTIAARSFTPMESHSDVPEPGASEPAHSKDFAVPFAPAQVTRAATIQLLRGKQVVTSTRASAKAPRVSITSPKASQQLGGERVTVSWQANDADSRALSTTVLYRPTPNAAWKPLALDVRGTSIDVPRLALAGSTAGEIRLITTDGVRFGTASVRGLRVPDRAPTLVIEGVSSAEYDASQNLQLAAVAWDREDGVLDEEITWTSSIDGLLGRGRMVDLRATDLSEGVHTVTVRATDSRKNVTSRTISIAISRVAEQVTQPQG